ncbi:MAG: GNAT family N-acetyltransferase [Alphaproteobacteria bacterium]|nr:GNAT family N-acetyltransferase [Alphaproteobacteria bacterium]
MNADSPPLAIRTFRESDRPGVIALWAQTLGHAVEVDRDLDFIQRWSNARLYVGLIGDTIVATAAVGHEGNRGWLHRVATHPDHRRKGYARALIAQGEAWLARLDLPKVNLQIRGHQPGVQAFYESIGYVVEDRTSMGKRLVPVGTGLPVIDITVTHLEMTAAPRVPAPPPPALKLAVLRAEPISVPFYRYLYNTVGETWLWWDRRRMSDATLAAIIGDKAVEVYVLYVNGEPAGFIELDRRDEGAIAIAYFGLMPHFIGRGLGPWFLHWGIDVAWRYKPARLTVSTCTLDHPKALALYQRMGFEPVRQSKRQMVHPGHAP